MKTFSALLAICAGNSPFTGEFPAKASNAELFDVFFDLRLNKRLSIQLGGWWFETPSRPLWRHCDDVMHTYTLFQGVSLHHAIQRPVASWASLSSTNSTETKDMVSWSMNTMMFQRHWNERERAVMIPNFLVYGRLGEPVVVKTTTSDDTGDAKVGISLDCFIL